MAKIHNAHNKPKQNNDFVFLIFKFKNINDVQQGLQTMACESSVLNEMELNKSFQNFHAAFSTYNKTIILNFFSPSL